MAAPRACIACNHAELIPGRLQTSGRVSFYPDQTKFFTLSTSDVPCAAWMCSVCGFVQILADVGKAKKVTPKQQKRTT